MAKHISAKYHHEESSESEAEIESKKKFHRQLSTNNKSSLFDVSHLQLNTYINFKSQKIVFISF